MKLKPMIMVAMLLGFGMPSLAQAESLLLTLPFGMEIGKKISEQIAGRCYNERTGNFNCRGKFRGIITKDKKLKSLVFANGGGYKESLPTRWKGLGLYLKTDSKDGISMEKALQIIRKQGAEHIETESRYVEFDLAGKYHFTMMFEDEDETPGGLWVFRVNGNTLIEDY